MSKKHKRRRKKKVKAELYEIEIQTMFKYIHYVWYNNKQKLVNDSIETIFHPYYAEEHFHPYHIMKGLNCKLRA